MVQNRIVQHHHTRRFECPLIDIAMQLIIAHVVKRDIGIARVDGHLAQWLERAQQRRRIIGHAGPGGGQRGEKSDLQSFFRGPNSAVPMRTMVAPSSIAASRSCDIPIDNCGR